MARSRARPAPPGPDRGNSRRLFGAVAQRSKRPGAARRNRSAPCRGPKAGADAAGMERRHAHGGGRRRSGRAEHRVVRSAARAAQAPGGRKRTASYVVFHDSTLREMVERRPVTLSQFAELPGWATPNSRATASISSPPLPGSRVLLEHLSFLHDEVNVFQLADVGQRIAVDRNDVRDLPAAMEPNNSGCPIRSAAFTVAD